MKKLLFLAIATMFAYSANSQQQFNVNVSRPKKGGSGKIIVQYLGQDMTRLKGNSNYVLTGILPSDSIIPLVFKRPMDWPNKYFLYPNASFNYDLELKIGMVGTIKVTDRSVYPEAAGSASATASKTGILPKGVSINKRNLGVSYINEKTLSSDKIREQWTRVGGKIVGRSISYVGTFAGMKMKDATSTTSTSIMGGGYVLTQNHYNLKIPEFKTGLAPWTSFIYGTAFSMNMHVFSTKIDFVDKNIKDMDFGSGSFVFMLSGNLGYTIGLGKFKTQTDYKGVAIDLTYRPSIIANLNEAGSTTQLNMKGFGFDLSRTSFSAFANSLAPKAKSKFSFFFLPPIKDTPLMITIGYGLVWYR